MLLHVSFVIGIVFIVTAGPAQLAASAQELIWTSAVVLLVVYGCVLLHEFGVSLRRPGPPHASASASARWQLRHTCVALGRA